MATSQSGSRFSTGRRVAISVICVVAIGVAIAYIAFGLATAGPTFGCDYFTYADAAVRHLTGSAIYQAGPARTGECGLYQYPPPFVLLMVPFVMFGYAGVWLWICLSIAAFSVGVAIIPVRPEVRLIVFLLGAVSWPFIFGLRIGQVGPLLLLLYAVGWRFIETPTVLGVATALGALVKVQPAIIAAWLIVRLNIRAIVAVAVTLLIVSAAAATAGLADWSSYFRVIGDISNAVDVPNNLSIGATAYRLGLAAPLAAGLQTVNTVAVLVAVVLAGRYLSAAPGFLVAVTASQIVSPIVWSHYAIILLLPVAWLLDRGLWWAALIPISHAWMLILVVPEQAYTVPYYLVIAALIWVGRKGAMDYDGSRHSLGNSTVEPISP
jgi:hypothetical protein